MVALKASVIIVTGEYASGKTSFCRHLQYALTPDTETLNVGAILESKLFERNRSYFAIKAEIGQAFLREFRETDILKFIIDEVQKCVKSHRHLIILDGIRLASTYRGIRFAEDVIFHVHLSPKLVD